MTSSPSTHSRFTVNNDGPDSRSSGGGRPVDPLSLARRVGDIAGRHAATSEQQRRLAQPVVDALVESGLARLIAPSRLGGWALSPATLVDVIATIAAADPSAGWCAAIGMGTNHFAGYIPQAAARELFVDLSRPGCGVFAPGGRGVRTAAAYRVSGRWPFASGSQHAAVQASGIIVVDEHGAPEIGPDGAPLQRLAVIPIESLTIHDTWDTVGLRGTGSHDTVAADVAVPEDHTMHFSDASWTDDALYQMPLFSILAPCLASAALGTGRAALDVVEQQACADLDAPPRPGPRPRFSDDPFGQRELGRAEVRLRAARAVLREALNEGYELAVDGRAVPRTNTALIGLTCGEAMDAAVNAVDVACRISGTASVRRGAPLERARRDIDTMRKHVLFSPGVGQPLGRQIAGVPTVAAPFLARPI